MGCCRLEELSGEIVQPQSLHVGRSESETENVNLLCFREQALRSVEVSVTVSIHLVMDDLYPSLGNSDRVGRQTGFERSPIRSLPRQVSHVTMEVDHRNTLQLFGALLVALSIRVLQRGK